MPIFKCAGTQRFDDAGEPLCDHEDKKRWFGACPGCGRFWNIIKYNTEATRQRAKTFGALEVKEVKYIPTGIEAFDRVIGGGLVAGSTIVISGPPKTGKSTLLVQIAAGIGKKGRVLYASGEQSETDVGLIVHRTGSQSDNVELMGNCGDVSLILERTTDFKPKLVIVDSLHTAFLNDVKADAGSSAQVKAIANEITEYGKKHNVCFVLICHVNKELELAGPQTLSHVVDTLVEFNPYYDEDDDPEEETLLRELYSSQNRNANGPRAVKELFEMTETGIKPIQRKEKKSNLLKMVDRWKKKS